MEETEVYQVIIIEGTTSFHQICDANDYKVHNYFIHYQERRNAVNTSSMPSLVRCFQRMCVVGGGSMP